MSHTDHYARALSLARDSQPEQAIIELREHLVIHGDDGPAWNDAGVILHRLGLHQQAMTCLERALQLVEDPEPVCENFLDLCRAAGRRRPIAQMIDRLYERGALSLDRAMGLAESLTAQNRLDQAIEIVLAASRHVGPEPQLEDLALRIRCARGRIAFFCGGDGPTFLQPILTHLGQRFSVRYFEGRTVQDVHRLMAWSQISWFEWCTELAEIGTQAPISCKKVARLHRYEAYADWPKRIRWQALDALITVGNPFVRSHLLNQVPELPRLARVHTIPNGVDLEQIRFRNRQRGKNLAFIADMRLVKNPMLLLQCIHRLIAIDPAYRLFWAGRCPDAALDQYIRHMTRSLGLDSVVHWEGWQEDMADWLSDKHYILSSSVIESQGMGVLEAMAAGLRPVVHSFPGAAQTFGDQWLFNTAQDFCKQVLSGPYEPARYRRFVAERYALADVLERVESVLEEVGRTQPRGEHDQERFAQARPVGAAAPVF